MGVLLRLRECCLLYQMEALRMGDPDRASRGRDRALHPSPLRALLPETRFSDQGRNRRIGLRRDARARKWPQMGLPLGRSLWRPLPGQGRGKQTGPFLVNSRHRQMASRAKRKLWAQQQHQQRRCPLPAGRHAGRHRTQRSRSRRIPMTRQSRHLPQLRKPGQGMLRPAGAEG